MRAASWGVVRVEAELPVRASPEQLAGLYLDYARWPELYPDTIAGVQLQRREGQTLTLEVQHRTAGRVLNVLRPRSGFEVELFERKPRYQATFLNRFEPAAYGTRYVVCAEVQLRWPYRLLAPLLHGYVRRAIRRFVLAPMRAHAEQQHAPGD